MIWNLIQRELRRSEAVEKGQLNDLNKRPTSYLFVSQLSGTTIIKYKDQRILPKSGMKELGLRYLNALGFGVEIYTTPAPISKTQRAA